MAQNSTPVFIEGEEQAWKLFSDLVRGRGTVPSDVRLEFHGWPKLSLTVNRGQSIITPTMMRGFVGLQDSIYRSHTLVNYDSYDLRKLSDSERTGLEFEVRVSKGSSHYDANLWPAIEKIGLSVVDKMDPFHLTITILGLGVLAAGGLSWKWYLQNKTEIRKAEIQSDKDKEFLQTLQYTSKEETERLKVFERAIKKSPILEDVNYCAEEGKDALVSSMRDFGETDINGIKVPGEVADELMRSARRRSEEKTIKSKFRVLRVDTTSPDGFRVRLEDIASGEQVTARLRDVLADEKQGKDLRRAEWSKKPVFCELTARVVDDEYRSAVIKSTRLES